MINYMITHIFVTYDDTYRIYNSDQGWTFGFVSDLIRFGSDLDNQLKLFWFNYLDR